MEHYVPTRRSILLGSLALGGRVLSSGRRHNAPILEGSRVRFGVITDVHHGLANRTEARLEEFLIACEKRELDFIIQMGDFNHPVPEAQGFLKLWHSHKGQRWGVLGNHDMDMGSKKQALDNWQLKSRYYSFDSGFLHFVVLDANFFRVEQGNARLQSRSWSASLQTRESHPRPCGVESDGDSESRGPYASLETRVPSGLVPYENGNWYRGGITASWIDPEQIEWLASDLKATRKPTVVFVHQPLDDIWEGGSVPNRVEVRKVLEESGKVVAVLQGHNHQDASETRNGILYWRVNSASYAWVGEKYGRMADYDRSLFAFVEIGDMGTKGQRDQGTAPWEAKGEGRRAKGVGPGSEVRGPGSHHPITSSSHHLHFSVEGRRGIFEGDSPFTRGVPNFHRFSPSITSVRVEI
ncbi:MAG: metallophosphoesterase [Armatimonadetes bacterium]|nr:metallophosphoesterase [Armatimonadota bacterium]